MSIKCNKICEHIETLCPKNLTEEWDNVGLLVGDPEQEVQKVLVALDATPEVILEAIKEKVDMIVTHHPLFIPQFSGPIKSITTDSLIGKAVITLVRNNISLYCAHTNLDIATGGVNDVLGNTLGLEKLNLLQITTDDGSNGIGRIGILPEETELGEFAKVVKQRLKLETIRLIGDAKVKVQKVALCSGSGMSMLNIVAESKADVFVTGDVKYHEAQEALAIGINIIDVGHYQSENIIVPVLSKYIEKMGGVEVIESRIDGNPFKVL